ncbi:MAG: hypothetical protein QG635_371 [Bacteroidota bacterium]|nr:hypothetical protein [Bacteroidota bacterium]
MQKIFIAILLLNIAICNELFSQENSKGIITGRVISNMSKQPLPGITVSVLGTKLGAISRTDGNFDVKNLPVGIYSVQFKGVGYITYVRTDVVVNNVKPAQLEIELVEKIVELGEVEVRGSYFNRKLESITSTQTLGYEDIRRAPGVQEDVIRAAALLPGVGVTQAGRNDLVVRGGAPFENLFIVDNIEVPNINHFGTQGSTGGPLSIINLDYVRDVSFSAGGFGAKYGDKTSSIMNISLRKGNEERFTGGANLSATGFGIMAEGPLSNSGSYIINVRRSYLDFIFKAAGFSFIPEYWDFITKADYRLSSKDNISFLAIGALGSVKLNNETQDNRYDNSRVAIPSQDQYFSGITYQRLFDEGFATITLGRNYTVFSVFQNDSNLIEIFRNKSEEAETILKTDFDFILSKKCEISFGNQLKYAPNLDYNIKIPGFIRRDQFGIEQPFAIDSTFSVYKNATYANATSGIGQNKLTLGARLDYYSYTQKNWYFSPRLSFVCQLNPISAIVFSSGRYYQAPSYIWLIGGSEEKLKPIKADQVVLGYEHNPYEFLKVQLEVYYKIYDDYPARVWRRQAVLAPSGFDDVSSDIPFGLEPLRSVATGFSRGVELFIQKKLNEIPFYGLMSISFSETKFKSIEDKERHGAFDTRFIFNISGGYRFNSEWEASAKFRVATGLPTTPFIESGENIGQLNYTLYNEGERLPLFNSLDVRVDKKWNYEYVSLTTYIDIQNIYGRKNVSQIKWNQRTLAPEKQESIGIFPTIGVSLEF